MLTPQDWPEKGVVVFNQYSTRYREGLDLVVKDINFNVGGGEKVNSTMRRMHWCTFCAMLKTL